MKPGVVSLVVISDIVRPRLLLRPPAQVSERQRELQKAIKEVDDCGLTIKVEHRPFLLHPTMEEDQVIDRATFYREKFGEEKLKQIKQMVTSRAEDVGVEIRFDGQLCQTIRAHRLLRKAFEVGGQELQEKVQDVLFYTYFTEGKDVSDLEYLTDLADTAGVLTKDQALEFFKSDEYRTEVEHMANEARKKGVTGVPFTIINGKWAVSGGQTSDVYTQDGNIAYISDVGADILKPLFIVGCTITGLSFFLSSAIERTLRHQGRLVANMRRRERILASLAVFFAFVGMCGLILLSIFDTKRFTKQHRVFLLVFIVGVGMSAIFTVIEYRWLSHDFVELRKLKTLYIVKGIIAAILIILAIAFAITLFEAIDPGEWTISFGFTFYLLTFFFDLRMSKGVHKGELSRERLLAMQQNGQSIAATREANQGNGAMPGGHPDQVHGYGNGNGAGTNEYGNGAGTNGYAPGTAGVAGDAQMSHANGPATFGNGNAPIAHPANTHAANGASVGYP
ncbi:hypothetical protein TRAPUB_1929 [Trametes pubescens]|uniref:CWH43-like N-terminal domain-containing protein n=1 Tax=Trametes pubescens TaxID=154538 RepID=A0A1M2VHY0_TRAPU|nr:hypothetical protein TRAPUB_1929 [Trametes pubescens]